MNNVLKSFMSRVSFRNKIIFRRVKMKENQINSHRNLHGVGKKSKETRRQNLVKTNGKRNEDLRLHVQTCKTFNKHKESCRVYKFAYVEFTRKLNI